MKICVILPSLAKKGPNQVAYDIICNLLAMNCSVYFEVYYFSDCDSHTLAFPCVTRKISFFENVDFSGFDVVHSHMLIPDFYVFKTKLLNQKKIKFLSTLHQKDYYNLSYDYNSRIKAISFSLLWRVVLSLHDHIIYLSESMRLYYKYKHLKNINNSSVIFNGRTYPKVVSNRDLYNETNKSVFNLSTACLLTKRKGLEQVILALPSLPSVVFHVIGDGVERRNLEDFAKEANVEERVIFHGFSNDVGHILMSTDAFILPSRAEGFPLALLEAASLNLPCICSRIDITEEVFSENEVSFFELDNIASIHHAIQRVIDEPEKYKLNLRNKYLSTLTGEVMAKNYYQLYHKLSCN